MVLHLRGAAHGVAGHAVLALVGRERVQDGEVGEERREQLIAHHRHLEGLARAARGLQVERHRNHRRAWAEGAGNRRRAVLQHGADDVARAGDLHRAGETRQHDVDVRPGQRERGRAEAVERMAEGVHPIAVHLGDRAGGAEFEIAAHQRDADGIARAQRARRGRRRILLRQRAAGHHRQEAAIAEGAHHRIGHGGVEPAERNRRGNRTEQGADAGAHRGAAEQLHVVGAVGERPGPREGLRQRRAKRVLAERHRQLDACRLAARSRQGRRVDHLVERGDAGDRLLRELAERVRDGADDAAVDVHRAAAHAGDDAGVGERTALEPRENQVAPRTDDVAEHAEDVDLELVEPVALEDGAPRGHHAGPEVIDREDARLRRQPADEAQHEQGDRDAEAGRHRTVISGGSGTGRPRFKIRVNL